MCAAITAQRPGTSPLHTPSLQAKQTAASPHRPPREPMTSISSPYTANATTLRSVAKQRFEHGPLTSGQTEICVRVLCGVGEAMEQSARLIDHRTQ